MAAFCDTVVGRTIQLALEDLAIESVIMRDNERKIQANRKGDSRCLLCGRIYYNQITDKCPRCGGKCRVCPADELEKSTRFQH